MSLAKTLENYYNFHIKQSAKHDLHPTEEEARNEARDKLNKLPLSDALDELALYESEEETEESDQ